MLGDQTCRIEQDILLTDEFGLKMGLLVTFAGTTVVIVVTVVSSVVVFVLALAIGVYILKRKNIEKKRRGNMLICDRHSLFPFKLLHAKCLTLFSLHNCFLFSK